MKINFSVRYRIRYMLLSCWITSRDVYLIDPVCHRRRYRSPYVSRRIRRNIPGNAREETHDRSKVASSPETRTKPRERPENKCATRATQKTTIPEMPLQIRAMPARWCARRFKRTVRLFPPPSASSSFFSHLPPSHLFGPPVFPCSILLQLLGRAMPSSTLSRVFSEGRGTGEAEGNAVTRENPLRNVFGPCTARYYLQSRACIKYMCEKRKEDARNFKRERFGTRRKLVTRRKMRCTAKTKVESEREWFSNSI